MVEIEGRALLRPPEHLEVHRAGLGLAGKEPIAQTVEPWGRHGNPSGMDRRGWPWIDRSPRTVGVFLLDVALIAGVLGYGLITHQIDPLANVPYTLRTIGPFVLLWTVLGPACGVYSVRASANFRWGLLTVLVAWPATALVGVAIRATSFHPGGADPIFVLVTIGTGLLVLLPGRVAVLIFSTRA